MVPMLESLFTSYDQVAIINPESPSIFTNATISIPKIANQDKPEPVFGTSEYTSANDDSPNMFRTETINLIERARRKLRGNSEGTAQTEASKWFLGDGNENGNNLNLAKATEAELLMAVEFIWSVGHNSDYERSEQSGGGSIGVEDYNPNTLLSSKGSLASDFADMLTEYENEFPTTKIDEGAAIAKDSFLRCQVIKKKEKFSLDI